GLVARSGDVDREPGLVLAPPRLAAELGQPAVARLAQATAERVGFAVRDPRRTDPESVEDVEAVDLVLDRRRRLERRDESDLTVLLRAADVVERFATHDEVLVRDVRKPHPEVVDDVVPFPAGLRRDRRGAVHEAVEDRVEPGDRHPRVPGEVTAWRREAARSPQASGTTKPWTC